MLFRVFSCALALTVAVGCSDGDDAPPPTITFGEPGSTSAPSGAGSFTFGVATAATQIEDQNEHTDWYAFTAPEPEGLGEGHFVGDAVQGFTRAIEDIDLIEEMNLDSYRFSIEWARIEPTRGEISEEGLAHYDAMIDELVARGIEPMVTVLHFSNPVWLDDPRIQGCIGGPTDTHLCGWNHPEGAELAIAEVAAHARLLAERYGDRVDDWCTVNEPINYLIASYGVGVFPPGKGLLLPNFDEFMVTVRNYIRAHVAIYDAIKAGDTIDADGDGVAASVGFTLNTAEWVPARDNLVSDNPEDLAAVDRVEYAYHHVFVESIRQGRFDTTLNGELDEAQPDWEGKLDWLGVQYYSIVSVSADRGVIPGVDAIVCFGGFDLGSCLTPEDPTKFVPSMNYEYFEPGVYNVLMDFSTRWPDLPLTVSESGLATKVGARRSEHVVRSLEQIERARVDGADVRGYYHWSLTDNFEWAEGYEPRFGLYSVDLDTYERTPTAGAVTLGEIAGSRELSSDKRVEFGGLGSMTPEQ